MRKFTSDFDDAVNMSAAELEDWLETQESQKVGWKGADGKARESVGHASGRKIVAILRKKKAELDDDRLCAHAQGRRLCPAAFGPAAGEYLHLALAL